MRFDSFAPIKKLLDNEKFLFDKWLENKVRESSYILVKDYEDFSFGVSCIFQWGQYPVQNKQCSKL